MSAKEKEFIDHLREVLQTHEEPYSEGAWEKFTYKPTAVDKRKFIEPSIIAAASILLLLAGGLWLYFYTNNKKQAAETATRHTPANLTNILTDTSRNINNSTFNVSGNTHIIIEKNKTKYVAEKKYLLLRDSILTTSKIAYPHPITNQLPGNTEEKLTTTSQAPTKETLENILVTKENNNQNTGNETSTKNNVEINNFDFAAQENIYRRWNVAAQIASSFTNYNKVNMSYGINIGYAFNEKISIHTGAAYAQMNAAIQPAVIEQNYRYNSLAPPLFNDHMPIQKQANPAQTRLTSAALLITGIEIPVEMRYNITKKLYGNVGISGMALLKNKQTNTFVSEKESPVGFTLSSDLPPASIIQTTRETVTGTDAINHKVLPFFNISFGYKQPLSRKKNMMIEPFIKIPVHTTSAHVPLSNAGLRVGVDL